MSTPGQLGDGGRSIPIAERSRRKIGGTLLEVLSAIRRKEGVDPRSYPPVASDILYDTRMTMVGAEMAARETAELLLPTILDGPEQAACKTASLLLPTIRDGQEQAARQTADLLRPAILDGQEQVARKTADLVLGGSARPWHKSRVLSKYILIAAIGPILILTVPKKQLAPANVVVPAVAVDADAEKQRVAVEIQRVVAANEKLLAANEALTKELGELRNSKTMSEAAGDALLEKGMVTRFTSPAITLTIPKSLTKDSGKNWTVDMPHKLTPGQLDQITKAIAAAKRVQLEE